MCRCCKYNKNLLRVGRFHFYTAAFEKANSILINAITQKPRWLIIDEAGKLELEGNGFFYSIGKAVQFYEDVNTNGNLLITVRKSLCDEVIAFFKIKNYSVIEHLDELQQVSRKKNPR